MPKVTQRAVVANDRRIRPLLSTISAITLSHYRMRRYRALSEGFRDSIRLQIVTEQQRPVTIGQCRNTIGHTIGSNYRGVW